MSGVGAAKTGLLYARRIRHGLGILPISYYYQSITMLLPYHEKCTTSLNPGSLLVAVSFPCSSAINAARFDQCRHSVIWRLGGRLETSR